MSDSKPCPCLSGGLCTDAFRDGSPDERSPSTQHLVCPFYADETDPRNNQPEALSPEQLNTLFAQGVVIGAVCPHCDEAVETCPSFRPWLRSLRWFPDGEVRSMLREQFRSLKTTVDDPALWVSMVSTLLVWARVPHSGPLPQALVDRAALIADPAPPDMRGLVFTMTRSSLRAREDELTMSDHEYWTLVVLRYAGLVAAAGK